MRLRVCAACTRLTLWTGPPKVEFDALVRAAAAVCGTPIALISLVDEDRQWFKAHHGLPGLTQTGRDIAFCAHTVARRSPQLRRVGQLGGRQTNRADHASNNAPGRTTASARGSLLEETASSTEEISSTVKQTADTVEGAMHIVRHNAAAATRGGEVIDQVVQTMQGIRGSSNKIGEIIAVIDSIAFQTNILALNAAVEAAGPGEQGRFFAVVATEVRAPAGWSSAAAQEIKALITASISQVESGSTVVAEVGMTMRDIVGNADKIAGLMSEIATATATREQSAGVGLVGSAMQTSTSPPSKTLPW
ncbi:MAG: hypothetical protein H7143_10265 [Pseudorhodobacter sp.]|nr:hypothetical protein [Rhizobacter sp.]